MHIYINPLVLFDMNIKNNLYDFFHPFKKINAIIQSHQLSHEFFQNVIEENRKALLQQMMLDKSIHSSNQGVSDTKYCDYEVIVSLTTHGKRIYDVNLAIESIMQGTLLPNKIILWISEDDYSQEKIPIVLRNQQKRGLDIRFCKDIGPYTKIIHCLKEYPNAIIITIDDDMIYNYNLLEKMMLSYRDCPNAIHANRIHKIGLNSDHTLKSYVDWEKGVDGTNCDSNYFFLTGVGGVLYPPHSLGTEVFNEKVFLDICRYADDVWLNAIAKLNGTEIKKVYTIEKYGREYTAIQNVKETGLCDENTNAESCRNDSQIKAVFEKYNIIEKIVGC